MHKLFAGKLKYLMLLPIIILISFALYFEYVYVEIYRGIFSDQMIEKKMDLDIISNMTDKLISGKDWDSNNYASVIKPVVEDIDAMQNVFAALYDEKGNLLSERNSEQDTDIFDPFTFTDFSSMVHQNESGKTELLFNRGGIKIPSTMNCYFRWIPSESSVGGRLLLVIGAVPEDAVKQPELLLSIGIVAQLVITFIINTVLILLLIYLYNNYYPKKEKKWRTS